ncbi:hypothetical protein L4D76_22820 [Photobacterium sagamiensis]|uniref:hypothetical protein n=1 Tax=Photobacterium sagamiensis TaxID=2910241 RepID=UPI003D0FD5E4
MAQATFKSWFVDFDPVKIKMRGEQTEGMDMLIKISKFILVVGIILSTVSAYAYTERLNLYGVPVDKYGNEKPKTVPEWKTNSRVINSAGTKLWTASVQPLRSVSAIGDMNDQTMMGLAVQCVPRNSVRIQMQFKGDAPVLVEDKTQEYSGIEFNIINAQLCTVSGDTCTGIMLYQHPEHLNFLSIFNVLEKGILKDIADSNEVYLEIPRPDNGSGDLGPKSWEQYTGLGTWDHFVIPVDGAKEALSKILTECQYEL